MSEYKLFEVINPRGKSLWHADLETEFGGRLGLFASDVTHDDVFDKFEAAGDELDIPVDAWPLDVQRVDDYSDPDRPGYSDLDAHREVIEAGYCCVYLPDRLETHPSPARCADGSLARLLFACRPK